jgi:hypothetical protein
MFDHHPDSWELSLACLALGILLGMIGGLHIALALMQGLTQRLDDLERKETPP